LSNKLTHILHGNSMDGHRGDQDRGRKEGKGGESGWSAYPRVKRKLDALREQEKASEEQKVIKKAREEQAAATQAMIQASIRQAFGSVPGGASLSSSAATPTGSHASSSASEEPVDAEEEEEEESEEYEYHCQECGYQDETLFRQGHCPVCADIAAPDEEEEEKDEEKKGKEED
jgi:hypothetical protein